MQARENTVKTVGMYKETMKLLLRCTNKRAFPLRGRLSDERLRRKTKSTVRYKPHGT